MYKAQSQYNFNSCARIEYQDVFSAFWVCKHLGLPRSYSSLPLTCQCALPKKLIFFCIGCFCHGKSTKFIFLILNHKTLFYSVIFVPWYIKFEHRFANFKFLPRTKRIYIEQRA